MRNASLLLFLPLLLSGWQTCAGMTSSPDAGGNTPPPSGTVQSSGVPPVSLHGRVYRCSELGCPTDGVTPIDSIVQPILASASASSPVSLILDGPLFLTCGLYIADAGYTEISGLGMGATRLKIKPRCNQHVLRLGADPGVQTDTGVLGMQTAAQISIHDLTLDGNRGYGYLYPRNEGSGVGTGNSSTTDARGRVPGEDGETRPARWLFDLDISNAHDVSVDHVSFEAAPTFSFRASNTTNISVTNNRFVPFGDTPVQADTNTDGLHFSGFTTNAWIDNNYCRTGDDCVAFNTPEGTTGDIRDIHLSRLTLNGAQTGVRIYAVALNRQAGTINHLEISDVSGTANEIVFMVGLELPHPQTDLDVIRNISIDNVHVTAKRFMMVVDSIGSMQISNSFWKAQRAIGMITAWRNNMTWGTLSLTNCGILRNANDGTATSVIDSSSVFEGTALSIQQLTITDFAVQDVTADGKPASYRALPLLNVKPGTTINVMKTNGLSAAISPILAIDGVEASPSDWLAIFPAGSLPAIELHRQAAAANTGTAVNGFLGAPYMGAMLPVAGGAPNTLNGAAGSNSSSNSTNRAIADDGRSVSAPYQPAVMPVLPVPATSEASRTVPDRLTPENAAASVGSGGPLVAVTNADRAAAPIAAKALPPAEVGSAHGTVQAMAHRSALQGKRPAKKRGGSSRKHLPQLRRARIARPRPGRASLLH